VAQRAEQRQVRGLALSQQMRLSLDLLRMDGGRLRRRLRLEAARNPCLELVEAPEVIGPRQALLAQVGLMRLTAAEADLARALVHCLDDHGWLCDPLPEIAGWLGLPPARIEALLPRLQQLDPPGIFARDLAESLRLQLQARDRFDPMIARLLERLDLAAAGDIAAIAAHCGCDAEDAAGMLADLRALAPWPLAEGPPAAPPELELGADGTLRHIGHADVSLRAGASGQDAAPLLAALAGRTQTLLRIARVLTETQASWLQSRGDLVALTMTALAQALDLDKSTVSRAVAGVSLRTPRGVLDLRALLPQPVSRRNPGLTSDAARQALRQVLADWPKGRRVSDAGLARALAGRGVVLSRRTLAKYRAAMGIAARGK
jgi:RNA polymerase sigma-54 factor